VILTLRAERHIGREECVTDQVRIKKSRAGRAIVWGGVPAVVYDEGRRRVIGDAIMDCGLNMNFTRFNEKNYDEKAVIDGGFDKVDNGE
jgi:hypothetical protein